jgi:hypothetical protein
MTHTHEPVPAAELAAQVAELRAERVQGWQYAAKMSAYARHREGCRLSLVLDEMCSCGLSELRVIVNLTVRALQPRTRYDAQGEYSDEERAADLRIETGLDRADAARPGDSG